MHGGRGRETGRRRGLHQRSPGADAGAKTIRPPDRMLILDNSPMDNSPSHHASESNPMQQPYAATAYCSHSRASSNAANADAREIAGALEGNVVAPAVCSFAGCRARWRAAAASCRLMISGTQPQSHGPCTVWRVLDGATCRAGALTIALMSVLVTAPLGSAALPLYSVWHGRCCSAAVASAEVPISRRRARNSLEALKDWAMMLSSSSASFSVWAAMFMSSRAATGASQTILEGTPAPRRICTVTRQTKTFVEPPV